MKRNSIAIIFCLLAACSGKKNQFDAEGSFEADEVIVSS